MNDTELTELLLKLSQVGANLVPMLTRGSPSHKLGLSMLADLESIYKRTLGKELAEDRKAFFDAAIQDSNRQAKRHMERVGPKLWAQFHRNALKSDNSKEHAELEIEMLRQAIPCGECKAHFMKIVEENPFKPNGGPGLFFDHTVLLHNLVNRQLGKPELSREQAYAAWK